MSVRVLQLAGTRWTDKTTPIPEFCSRQDRAQNELIFFNSHEHQLDGLLKTHITRYYNLPESYWSLVYLRSNGFAFCEKTFNHDGIETGFSIYFRFLIKHVKSTAGGEEYSWDEMTFLLYLGSNGSMTSMFIDCPHDLQKRVVSMFPTTTGTQPLETLVSFLHSLVMEIVVMYDDAVWAMRDVIRGIEKDRARDPVFADIHNQARHAIHISEVLEVAVRTVTELQACVKEAPNLSVTTNATATPYPSMAFNSKMQRALHMLQNVQLRSRTIEKRFLNEINLAFNLVSQKDSDAMKEMSFAMRTDSHAMRTIAVVTLSFLPATFVSTIFGMAFFNTSVDDATGKKEWVVATEFWIYWVIAVPLTLMTLGLWKFWTPKQPGTVMAERTERYLRSYTMGEKVGSLAV